MLKKLSYLTIERPPSERRYFNTAPSQQLFSISTQHYAVAVNAFVEMIKKYGKDKYQFTSVPISHNS
jgi:hypothetical protein